MFTRVAAGVALLVAVCAPWSAVAIDAASEHQNQPTCTVTRTSGLTNASTLQLANGEVLCVSGLFSNKGTITVASGGSAVIEASSFTNGGTVNVVDGTSLEFTDAPTNLQGTTLSGGKWLVAGTLVMPGEIVTLRASLALSGSGEIEDATSSANAVDALATIARNATFVLENSAYLGTGSVSSAGTVRIGTKGNSGDSVNWQDSGTYTMTGGSFTFLDANACINVGSRAFTMTGGIMTGFGMLTGTVSVSHSAVFAPTLDGDEAYFWLNGSYTQIGGTFEDTINNPSGTADAGEFEASGAVSLGGTLKLISTGQKPATGTALEIASGSSISANFAAIQNTGVAGFSESTVGSDASVVTMADAPPSAPRSAHAMKSGTNKVRVAWHAPSSNGGKPVTGYIVVAQPSCSACKGLTAAASARSTVVSGIHSGTRYSFTVEARNPVGTGVASATTNSVK